jgi:hypothetical protein
MSAGRLTRRGLLAGSSSLLAGRGATADEAAEAVEKAHREMFARFLDKRYGTTYDYAPPTGSSGSVSLPTPEECRQRKPNALGWWCPIENGGFFGGLYLSALSDRYRRKRTAERAEAARTVAKGLERLARIGATPGFIARGISTDGSSHYPASSSDQTFPWFYGMVSYLTSGIAQGKERAALIGLVEEVALGLEKNEWRMPCDVPDFGDFGDWLGAFSATRTTLTGAEPHFDAASRLLFVHLALYRLTKKQRWLSLYRERRDEKPNGSPRSRLEICARGVEYAAPTTPARYPDHPPLWTSASSQGALRCLLEMDPDGSAHAFYRSGLHANAVRAAAYVSRFRLYDNDTKLAFRHDWRFLNELWRPQESIQEGVKVATVQVREWHKQSPRKVYESDNVRDPLFAAWIVALSGDRDLIAKSQQEIREALCHYQWDRMHTAHFFMAECVYYCLPA